jgi:hypothetical protein
MGHGRGGLLDQGADHGDIIRLLKRPRLCERESHDTQAFVLPDQWHRGLDTGVMRLTAHVVTQAYCAAQLLPMIDRRVFT